MSASLPKGTRNMAADRRYAVGTQLMSTALIANSLPMAGSAILTEDTMNGVRKADRVAMRRADRLRVASSVMASLCDNFEIMNLGRGEWPKKTISPIGPLGDD